MDRPSMLWRKNIRDVKASLAMEQGVTLIELMIGAVVASIIVAAGFTILITTQKSTQANDQTVETQQNVRIAMDLLSRDIKHAGFGWTGPVGACTRAIVPLDHTPAGADTGPDSVRLMVPIGTSIAPAWRLASAVGGTATAGFNSVTLTSGAVANMATEAGGSLTGAIVSIAGVVTTTVISVAGDSINFAPISPPVAFPAGMPVYLLQCVTYSIGTTTAACAGTSPCLLRNGVSVADGIEDIQFAYACDGCNVLANGGIADRIIDDQNVSAGFDQADFVTNNAWSAAPLTPDTIRMVQVTVVARQTTGDQGMGEGQGAMNLSPTPLQVSDHNHGAGLFAAGDYAGLNPPYSNYRRRVVTRTVETRNQRGSGI
ncbi:MAG: PilW family protein [Nitrospirales bacterium]